MNYTISSLDSLQQRSAILDLWNRNLPGTDAERYAWLYERGPAVGWTARDRSDDVVGGAGLMRRRMKLFGDRITAGQAIDLNVDRRHRSFGPAVALAREVAAAADRAGLPLAYALPNQHSQAVLQRAGYREVGSLGRWARPLRWESIARDRAAGSAAGMVVSPCANLLLRLWPPVIGLRAGRNLRSTVQDHFDGRFDELWDSASGEIPIVGERTSAYLNWRFGTCSSAKHRVLCLCNRENKLLAYIVFLERDRCIYLSDFLACDLHHLRAALAELLALARRSRADAVITTFLGNPKLTHLLRRCGFWKRHCDWKLLVRRGDGREPVSNQGLWNAENWYLTRADIDTDF